MTHTMIKHVHTFTHNIPREGRLLTPVTHHLQVLLEVDQFVQSSNYISPSPQIIPKQTIRNQI